MPAQFHAAPVAQMDPVSLYLILKLRTDAFVVEQQCPYPELDGRDVEPGAVMFWAVNGTSGEESGDDAAAPTATLRILHELAGFRIGRVVAAPDARGTGVARELMKRALEFCAGQSAESQVVLDAQAPLQGWYEAFGFVRSGEQFLEDGIPHVPMRRG
ncbi:GNAT family N-acetyltransferase [Nesterenkonia sp. LB17]|uniref:GNAT family N-acetyltransferase n=1 Tax=Nesterenkonia sp. LB17 TaxID=2901230 RepID=UPI001F4C9507|nr:GNAT family N-acetyltransferase [Nesterenkonia sp. LB17]MCH8565712.1 GNAT family N-acetyltransferase [Nesterenkonia sp. LB17]